MEPHQLGTTDRSWSFHPMEMIRLLLLTAETYLSRLDSMAIDSSACPTRPEGRKLPSD